MAIRFDIKKIPFEAEQATDGRANRRADSTEIRTKLTLKIGGYLPEGGEGRWKGKRKREINPNTDAANREFGSSFAFLRIMSAGECCLCSAKFDDERGANEETF